MPEEQAFAKWIQRQKLYHWFNPPAVPIADQKEREQWAQYLETSPDTQIDSPEVGELLLREVKYLIDSKIDLIKTTDTKASTQVTIIGGGLGILSVLGASQSVMITSGVPWLLVLATFLVVLGAGLDLACLARGYRYTSKMPRIDIYNSQAVLRRVSMQGRVATAMIEGYIDYSGELTVINLRKSRLLKLASGVLVGGILCLVINAGWADAHVTKSTSHAACRFSWTSIHCILVPDEHAADRPPTP